MVRLRWGLASLAAVLAFMGGGLSKGGWKWENPPKAGADAIYDVPVVPDATGDVVELGANPADTVVDGWSWGDDPE